MHRGARALPAGEEIVKRLMGVAPSTLDKMMRGVFQGH